MAPSAGATSGGPKLPIGSGTFCMPLDRAAVTIDCQPARLSSRLVHNIESLTMIPARRTPELAKRSAYSPCQLSWYPSLTIMIGFRSSTGSAPCGLSVPASSVPPAQPRAPDSTTTAHATRGRSKRQARSDPDIAREVCRQSTPRAPRVSNPERIPHRSHRPRAGGTCRHRATAVGVRKSRSALTANPW